MTVAEANQAVVAALREGGSAPRRGAVQALGPVLAIGQASAIEPLDLAAVVLPDGRAGETGGGVW